MKVLIVEDNRDSKMLLKNIFLASHPEINIFEAENGKEAIEILKNNIIDRVYLDLDMPEMNGFEFLKKMQELNLKSQVIVTTGHATHEQIANVLKDGAATVYLKPLPFEKIANF